MGVDHDGWCFGCVDDAQEGVEGVWRFGPRNATALLEHFGSCVFLGLSGASDGHLTGISRGVVGLNVGVNHVVRMHPPYLGFRFRQLWLMPVVF